MCSEACTLWASRPIKPFGKASTQRLESWLLVWLDCHDEITLSGNLSDSLPGGLKAVSVFYKENCTRISLMVSRQTTPSSTTGLGPHCPSRASWVRPPSRATLLPWGGPAGAGEAEAESRRGRSLPSPGAHLHGTRPENPVAICWLARTEVPLPKPRAEPPGRPIPGKLSVTVSEVSANG